MSRFDSCPFLTDVRNEGDIGIDDAAQEFQAVGKVAEILGAEDDVEITQLAVHIDIADALGKDFLPLLQARPVLVELGLGRGYFFFRRRQIGRHRLVFSLSGFQALLDFVELIADVVDDHLGLGLLLTLLGHAGLDVVQPALQVIVGKGQETRR